ncbi:MAG: hypothetical protein ACON4O_00860 [Lentimonas sp.]
MQPWIKYLLPVLVALTAPTLAEPWKQGSIAICTLDEGIELFEMGAERPADISNLPQYIPGLLVTEAKQPGIVTMLTSNGVVLDFGGPGFFAIERFEQEGDLSSEWLSSELEPGKSRMILNIRAGRLFVDQSKLQPASQFVLESPVGRFSSYNEAIWMIALTKNARQRTHGFNIYCFQGMVEFVDFMDRTFTIRAGQQITGGGSALTPYVEIAQINPDGEEQMEDHALRSAAITKMNLSEMDFLAATKLLLNSVSENTTGPDGVEDARIETSLPVIIQYAPRASLVTPFKGVAGPPSDDEVDLF